MVSLEKAIAKLELGRIKLKLQETDLKMEQLNKLIEDSESSIEEQNKKYEILSFAAQLKAFFMLSQQYAEILEAANPSWDANTLRLIQSGIEARELRYKKAMKLFAELVV